jgi:hypothetical protein
MFTIYRQMKCRLCLYDLFQYTLLPLRTDLRKSRTIQSIRPISTPRLIFRISEHTVGVLATALHYTTIVSKQM